MQWQSKTDWPLGGRSAQTQSPARPQLNSSVKGSQQQTVYLVYPFSLFSVTFCLSPLSPVNWALHLHTHNEYMHEMGKNELEWLESVLSLLSKHIKEITWPCFSSIAAFWPKPALRLWTVYINCLYNLNFIDWTNSVDLVYSYPSN